MTTKKSQPKCQSPLNSIRAKLGTFTINSTTSSNTNSYTSTPHVEYSLFDNNVPNERKHLEMLFTDLVDKGLGSSAIVIGAPGSGKNIFVDSILRKLDSDITTDFVKRRTIVRLNGLICKDLKLSVQALTSTLHLEEELSQVIGEGNNFEDRLTEILSFLRESLISSSSSKPVIVILDKIELFCEQVGQALLYNLLDIVQAKQSPLCVIGITCRVDILELFEKRVKSRFSHRFLHVSPLGFRDWGRLLSKWVEVDGNKNWNIKMIDLLNDNEVKKNLQMLYDVDNSLIMLNIFLHKAISKCESEDEFGLPVLIETLQELTGSSKVLIGMDLTHCEMLLILGIQRICKNGSPAFNFDSIYDIVRRVAGDGKQDADKDELFSAFCNLEEYELIRPIDKRASTAAGGGTEKNELHFKSELTHLELEEIISKYPNLPSSYKSLL